MTELPNHSLLILMSGKSRESDVSNLMFVQHSPQRDFCCPQATSPSLEPGDYFPLLIS